VGPGAAEEVTFSHCDRGKTGRAGGAKRELKLRPCCSMAGLARAGIGVEVVGQKAAKRTAKAVTRSVKNCIWTVVLVPFGF